MQAVDADEIEAELALIALDLAHPRRQHLAGERCPALGTGAGIGDPGLGEEAAVEAHRDLEQLGPRTTGGARHSDAILLELGDRDGGEVGRDVGRQVAGGIVDLVEELLLHGRRRDAAAGTGKLGDDGATITADLGDREAAMSEVRDLLAAGIGEVAAGHLHAALEQVAHQRPGAEPRPVVRGPAEGRSARCQEKRRIGGPAAEDEIGAGGDRRQQRLDADIGVGADQPEAGLGDRAALPERGLGCDPVRHLVARDPGDAQAVQPQLVRDAPCELGRGAWVGDAHVGEDAGAAGPAGGQHGPQPMGEEAVVAERWILQPVAVAEGHRALAQALEDEPVELAAPGEVHGRVQPVGGETGATADAQRVGHFLTRAPCLAVEALPCPLDEPRQAGCPDGTAALRPRRGEAPSVTRGPAFPGACHLG